mgnify:CR=1 FL=1
MPNTTQTITRFALRVRTEEDSTDMLGDWLHEDRASVFPFRTFAEASAACSVAVQEAAAACGWSSWQAVRSYDEAQGGGFWFVATWEDEHGAGTVEGRVCVLSASFVL